ncbi:hypothetical protein H696_04349 [Fonticula alba]|uniref:Uncharacterized protein n=1 Tax=Fonticula alba TaxID=691883 RepID=A0A058Z3R9_FONAL|nr:hypothetical protein H696_04349 [Fonticula alba]KCV68929.1 hypothetical protein H696_04349 [Fonticula alba]|eukprot:XP_009496500.1 hypothetical protein H696_04349 [Fonticula alba]
MCMTGVTRARRGSRCPRVQAPPGHMGPRRRGPALLIPSPRSAWPPSIRGTSRCVPPARARPRPVAR